MRLCLFAFLVLLSASFTPSQSTSGVESEFTVYVFMAQRCNICKYYTPTLQELHAEYAGQRIQFEGVFPNAHSTLEEIEAFDREFSIPFPLYPDTANLADRFNATVTPEVVLVDANGAVLYQGRIDNSYVRVGRRRTRTTSSDLKDALKAVTSGKPVQVPQTPAIGCIIERSKK